MFRPDQKFPYQLIADGQKWGKNYFYYLFLMTFCRWKLHNAKRHKKINAISLKIILFKPIFFVDEKNIISLPKWQKKKKFLFCFLFLLFFQRTKNKHSKNHKNSLWVYVFVYRISSWLFNRWRFWHQHRLQNICWYSFTLY